jgi:protein disulfide isomerase
VAVNFGASGKVLPTAVFIKWPDSVFIFNEDEEKFSLETAENFVSKSLEGTYQTYIKSEPIPETNDEPVKIVVGKTFEQIVNDPTKHVFVEFYAPWCGHCQSLAPVWEELAVHFGDKNNNVVIAKFDGTANSLPAGLQTKGYPTLMLFTSNRKQGITFEGDRSLESLTDFVNKEIENDTQFREKTEL